jgi:putative zinc finger protein
MSDMLEQGASRGAGPLPPQESHDEFLELCATATTGALTADERRRLRDHLSGCESCREIMAQYETVLGRIIPALAPDPIEERPAASDWSVEQAEAALFARLREDENSSTQPLARRPESAGLQKTPATTHEIVWRHVWGQLVAALLLVAALGLIAYRTGIRRGLNLAPQALKPASAAPVLAPTPSAPKTTELDPVAAELRSQLDERVTEIAHLKAQLVQALTDRDAKEADRARLAQERADLSKQVELASANLETVQEKLNALASQDSQDNARAEALQERVDQLTASMGESSQEVARERELLDHDRDIRELMGSRDLYIAEVYDVAKTGDTQKPFGRVFYTRGKSLIFYAYDLDQQPGLHDAATFQAWGRVGPDRDQAVNLGILYQDNAGKKRWVVKSDNPKTLAQIDAVFVTVEPNGGSPRPSGKPLLFAYLKIQPNHP